MALACRNYTLYAQQYSTETLSFCVDNYGSNVPVTLQIVDPALITARYYWQMQLQRYENNKWNVIGERTGYVDYWSDSNRTFTNIAQKNKPMRVMLLTSDYHGDYGYSSMQWVM